MPAVCQFGQEKGLVLDMFLTARCNNRGLVELPLRKALCQDTTMRTEARP